MDKPFDMTEFDKTLTPEEREAPTYLEWNDSTLARAVRALAVQLKDEMGFVSIASVAAAIVETGSQIDVILNSPVIQEVKAIQQQ